MEYTTVDMFDNKQNWGPKTLSEFVSIRKSKGIFDMSIKGISRVGKGNWNPCSLPR